MVIVDIGAQNYDDVIIENNEYYLFEPEIESYNILLNKFKDKKNVKIFNIGLFNKKDYINLYVTEKSECSSIYEPNINEIKKYTNPNRFRVVDTYEISVDRFDNLIKLDKIDFLKIDTQGSEYEVIEGFGDSIKSVVTIKCECEKFELYKNQKLFKDIKILLDSKGFFFSHWERTYKYNVDYVVFGDAIFKNIKYIK
jgi:FkbM family methyltransferase